MRKMFLVLIFACLFCAPAARAQEKTIAIRSGQMWDGVQEKLIPHATIVVQGPAILEIRTDGSVPQGAEVIDLTSFIVLPGLMDTHTHVLLQGDPTADSYSDQILK